MDRRALSAQEVEAALASLAPWIERGGRLHREYRFADFVRAFAFMSGAAIEAQGMNHHPEWSNVYGRVTIDLWTHDRGGITALDVELARRFERLALSLGAGNSSATKDQPNS